MGAIRDLAEKFWDGTVDPRDLWKPTGQAEEIAPGLHFLHAFANVSVLRTGVGLLLIDTSNYRARDRTFAAVRAIDGAPLHAAIYTHGHADHACGLPPFLEVFGVVMPRAASLDVHRRGNILTCAARTRGRGAHATKQRQQQQRGTKQDQQ